MNIYIAILSLLVAALYAKAIFVALYYPLMVLSALGERCSGMLRLFLRAPLAACERLLRDGGARFVIYHIGRIPSVHLRRMLYRGMGVKIGARAVVYFRAEIRCPQRLVIGKGTIVGDNAILDARRGLILGSNVNLSSNVSIYTLQHDHRDPNFGCPAEGTVKFSVEIDDRAWLGSNVMVLPGVHIGEGAVCCAGCVVTKDVEPYAVVAGIPARKVGERPRNLVYEFNGKACRLY